MAGQGYDFIVVNLATLRGNVKLYGSFAESPPKV